VSPKSGTAPASVSKPANYPADIFKLNVYAPDIPNVYDARARILAH